MVVKCEVFFFLKQRAAYERAWRLVGWEMCISGGPLSGLIMDRYGRLHAMLPAYGLLGVGLALLAVAEGPTMATFLRAGMLRLTFFKAS